MKNITNDDKRNIGIEYPSSKQQKVTKRESKKGSTRKINHPQD